MTALSKSAKRIKAFRDFLAVDQAAFGKLFEVSQPAISDWEAGKTAPSAVYYVRLGNLAATHDRTEDAVYFWKRAGLDEQMMLYVTGKKLKAAPSKIVRTFLQCIHADSKLEVLNEMSEGSTFANRDVVIWAPAKDPNDLQPFWDQIVLADFDPLSYPQEGFRRWWPNGLFIGHLKLSKHMDQDFNWVAELGPLNDYAHAATHVIGIWQYPEQPALDKPADRQKAVEEARLQAPTKVRLLDGCRIRGRAIAWLSGKREEE